MTPAEWAETAQMDEDGYPTDQMVDDLVKVGITSYRDCEQVLDHLQTMWRWPTYFTKGQMRKGRRIWHVSTGGWSGHEALLGALERNYMFWSLCAMQWRRGGHYTFETRLDR